MRIPVLIGMRALVLALAVLPMLGACSSGSSGGGTGGTAGGTAASGGSSGHGGATASGGAQGLGGVNPSGGVPAAGGANGTGGAAGTSASGGTGGSAGGSAGKSGSGGTAAGGAAGMGGASGSGSGGASGSGGVGAGGSISTGPVAGHLYAAPTGTGTACSSAAPCSITQAQTSARAAVSANQVDVVVELADGTYRLQLPLFFTAADSGTSGHPVTWQAATGAHPVLSGGTQVTGWAISDSGKNIWKATVPSSFVPRQLYVDGKIATRARSSSINRTDMNMQTSGWSFTNSSLSFLNSLKQPARADLHAIGSWTDRYSPIQSVSNGTVTMVQPAWDGNTWGWDVIKCPTGGSMCNGPYRNGPIYVENDYSLLDQAGEWYQDTTAGALYYIPLSGQDMSKADVELPQLELLLAVGGACPSGTPTGGADCVQPNGSSPTVAVAYAAPAGGDPYAQPTHDITFSGLTFSHTSWLEPNSTSGYNDQQTGGYLVGPRSDYPGGGQSPVFESVRPHWSQMPGAVQVSNASNISFTGDRFVALGSVGLGIGNDANAHATGVGLGATGINVVGCVFSQVAGGGILIGGVRAWAHHPCGDKVCTTSDAGSKLINQNITIKDNLVHDIGIDYRDFAGIMFTYTTSVTVSHNEVYNVPYSGINSGYGWGTNDEGGNADYKTRNTGNLYLYQPTYASPTTGKNNTVNANYIHQGMLQMNDGGCHYNLGFQHGTVVTENYCEGKSSGLSGTYWGEYNDEGSAYITETKNVYANFGAYVTANANASNNTGHITFTNNWGNSASPGLNGPSNTVSGNVAISGDTFPSDAQAIVSAAGLEAAYTDLKSNP